jgi:hypothetical protein
VLLSLGIGPGVRRVIDPAFDVNVLPEIVRLLIGIGPDSS